MDKRIRIPRTELSIFPVVLGTVTAGGPAGDKALDEVISTYLDLGGNAIDTARVYTDGHSEEALGRWLRNTGRRSEIVLITKGGHPRLETMHTSRMAEPDMRSDLEDSLRALGTDCIDLYFFHRDNLEQPVAESLEIMEKFVREGKIRSYGCSNWTSDRIDEADAYATEHGMTGFVANQMLYNACMKHMKPFADDTMHEMDARMMQQHREGRLLAMPYFGVCSGFFHRYAAGGENAVRESPYCSPENLALAERLLRISRERALSLTAVILGFFFTRDFPVCPLYGPSSAKHCLDLRGITEIAFKAEDYEI